MGLIAIAGAGCRSSTAASLCPAIISPAVVVEIRDAGSGLPIAQATHGVVRDQAYVDSLMPYGRISTDPSTLLSLQGALGRPGEYTVEVERTGYISWTVSGVRVTNGECGPITVVLHANLVPATS